MSHEQLFQRRVWRSSSQKLSTHYQVSTENSFQRDGNQTEYSFLRAGNQTMTQQKTTLTLHKIHNWPNKPSLVLKIHSYMKRCCRFDQPGATVVCRVGHQMGREISLHVKGNHKVNYLQVWHLGFPAHKRHRGSVLVWENKGFPQCYRCGKEYISCSSNMWKGQDIWKNQLWQHAALTADIFEFGSLGFLSDPGKPGVR